MRVLVTGATNPFGEAIVRELARKGHHVRAFGVEAGDDRFAGEAGIKSFPGWVEVGGSIEPVLAEREALIHADCMDESGKKALHTARRIEQGTLYACYAAEREQVDHFIHVTPAKPGRRFGAMQKQAVGHLAKVRGDINVRALSASTDPVATARAVAAALEGLPMLGTIVGGNNNAVTD